MTRVPAWKTVSTLGLVALCALPVRAQDARHYTLRDVFAGIHRGEERASFASANPVSAAHIDALEGYFDRIDLGGASLNDVIAVYTTRGPDFKAIAGWNRDRWSPGLVDSLTMVRSIANGELYPALRRLQLPKPSLDSIMAPLDSLQDKLLAVQLASNKEKLRRFFIKYGPNAPRLNAAEVLLNYVAQLAIPGFLPSPDGTPTPNELVATYRTTDLTASQTAVDPFRAHVVTSGQVGLRRYTFDEGCGEGRFADLLHPCQWSLGGFLVGPSDSPLNSPWQLRHRGGFYLARGKYHVGAIFGGDRRLVFGVDQQLLPYVF